MTFDWWTLALQTVNLLVLVWILARFLFRPVTRIIADRQAAAHAALDEARAMREAATLAREAARADREEAKNERSQVTSAASRDAERERQRLIDAARQEAEALKRESEKQITDSLAERKDALDRQAATLAADIAERLLTRLPEDARIAGFIDGLARAVAELPDAARSQLVRDAPIRLRAARQPTESELDLLVSKIGAAIGREIRFDVEVDPDLIAGLEIDAPQATIRNHFRADLDLIRTELASDD